MPLLFTFPYYVKLAWGDVSAILHFIYEMFVLFLFDKIRLLKLYKFQKSDLDFNSVIPPYWNLLRVRSRKENFA
jgi:hypothetical protein